MIVYCDTKFSRIEADDALSMARSLGESHGWKERHTSFDLWHLAAAWALSAGVFLTFDNAPETDCHPHGHGLTSSLRFQLNVG